MEKTRKVLIMRTARMDRFKAVLEDIKGRFPQAEIFCFSQSDPAGELESIFGGRLFLNDRRGNLSPLRLNWDVVRKVRSENFDVVVVIYNNFAGVGYFNVELISLLMRPKRVLVSTFDGDYFFLRFFRQTVWRAFRLPLLAFGKVALFIYLILAFPVALFANIGRPR
ncbi:MAG: hypothetical protein ACUVXI_01415 [bacterium]